MAGAIGVRERGVVKGAEESRERGFGPAENKFVAGAGIGASIGAGVLLDGCGFGPGGISFRKAKEGTGAEVVQDIVVILILR